MYSLVIGFVLSTTLAYGLTVNDQVCQGFKNNRFDCFPETNGANQEICESRGCCWVLPTADDNYLDFYVNGTNLTPPACFFPKDYQHYNVEQIKSTGLGYEVELIREKPNYYPNPILKLTLNVKFETNSRIRLTFDDKENSKRWKVPLPLNSESAPPTAPGYTVEFRKTPFGIKIRRRGDKLLMFDTISVNAPVIFNDQFLQISTRVPTEKGFGFGERQANFILDFTKWTQIGMWARDQPPAPNTNLYGVHNFFVGLTDNGAAYGIFFLNSNAQEIIAQPTPALTYRTIGGIMDFFIFTGPSPAEVVQQYLHLIGRPIMPPFWSLGFHLCRFGYGSLHQVKKVISRNLKAGIPLDVQWLDIDYMNRYLDWTIDNNEFRGVSRYMNRLRNETGIRVVVIVDPAISNQHAGKYPAYDKGLQYGLFVNWTDNTEPLVGEVWPGTTVFPDFTHSKAFDWWLELAREFWNNQLTFDGLWIDMNEPANFVKGSINGCPADSNLDNPFYVPHIRGNLLFDKTICPSAQHKLSTHYNLHNLYGYHESVVTNRVLKELQPLKRPFLLSRSTFAGSGQYTFHWTGDNWSSWEHMASSIAQILNFNIFGIPMTGADICGFNGDTPEELCVRWMQLGAFYPFMRNHASVGTKHQDPAAWSESAVDSMKQAIQIRYSLLSYLYTLFYQARTSGTTVARPLLFEFSTDPNTFTIDKQFLLGNALLVTPVLQNGARQVRAYIPDAIWCTFENDSQPFLNHRKSFITLPAPLNVINVHQRGGTILPKQSPGRTITETQNSAFTLTACLDDNGNAEGQLFWDDGESATDNIYKWKYNLLEFKIDRKKQTFQSYPRYANFTDKPMELENITFVGIYRPPKVVTVNNQRVQYTYDKIATRLTVFFKIKFTQNIILKWT